ncbi:MAG: NADH-quinone oxidoreductase subunit A [Chloroflexi bacterium]|nr:NADH-quinone oxidoreductase subunit A [Chloroflexota bacterium]
MSDNYAVLATFLLAGVALAMLVLALARKQEAPKAAEPFESGSPSEHKTWVQFRVRYFLIALVFVAFDMEMVYMFPWAVVFKRVGLVAFMDMFVFIAVLAVAIAYAWKEGAFEWER